MTQDELRQLIDQAARERWTELNLRGLSGWMITEIPPEIGQLTRLEKLSIGAIEPWSSGEHNPLTTLPPEIGKLAGLHTLDLSDNQLMVLPPEIGKLSNLQILILSGNQLTVLPPEIGDLSGLRQLALSFNQLKVLPSEIGKLSNLQILNLHHNQLTTVPPEIGHLSNLQSLSLDHNQLEILCSEIGHLANLLFLDLADNRLTAVPVAIGLLYSLEKLELWRNEIVELPPEIGQLSNLQWLGIGRNKLAALPSEIGKLSNLQLVDLSHNQLTVLSSEIGLLSNLDQLDLMHNQLTFVPPEIGKLFSLQFLDLRFNQLKTLPSEIGHLVNMQLLSLSGNQLTAVPPEIGQLTNLKELYLGGNQLTNLQLEIGQLTSLKSLELSFNQLTMLPIVLRRLEKLEKLYLYDNPLPIPPELLGSHSNPGDPQAILDAYFQASRRLREAKLLLVGEGSVGKTSLVERLLWNQPPINRDKTPGVDIHPWELEMEIGDQRVEIRDGGMANDQGQMTDNGSRNTDNVLRVNVWDFGGQEIYHATHQFFLTHRSLYLLVMEARKDEAANRLDYWLRHVQSFAGEDAPLILVVNKSDQGRLALDERGLMLKYPAICAIVHTSCTSGEGIPTLRQAIETALAAMPHLNDHLPLTWFAVKEKLAALGKDTLPYESYVELCEAEGINHEAAQRTLARFLHDLGAALNFQDDRRLAGTHILNPEWVTGGIYTILNAPTLQERGLLHLPELDSILDRHRYPAYKHPFLLDIMHKFELCVPLSDGQHYLIPGLLPKERLAFDWPESGEPAGEPALEYRYAILPAAILSRLMVRLHGHTAHHTGQPIRWRNGLVLARDGCRALVIADPAAARLTIALDGPAPHRRHLLAVIRAELDEIHASFAHLEAAEWVPIPGKPGAAILYRALLNLEMRGIFSHYDPAHDVEIDVRALLDGIESPDERDIRVLVSQLVAHYNLAELRQLAFELDVNHEDLPHHTTLTELARELALYLRQHGRLPELAAIIKRR